MHKSVESLEELTSKRFDVELAERAWSAQAEEGEVELKSKTLVLSTKRYNLEAESQPPSIYQIICEVHISPRWSCNCWVLHIRNVFFSFDPHINLSFSLLLLRYVCFCVRRLHLPLGTVLPYAATDFSSSLLQLAVSSPPFLSTLAANNSYFRHGSHRIHDAVARSSYASRRL